MAANNHNNILTLPEDDVQYTQLKHQSEQLTIINQFSLALISITQLDELFDTVTSEVINRLGFVDCVIYLAKNESQKLVEVASMGVKADSEQYQITRTEIPFGQGITGHVAVTGQGEIIDDVQNDPRYLADARPAQSELCVPLLYDDQVLGVIDCEHPEADYFNQSHFDILTTVAAMMSAKIHQCQIMDNLVHTVAKLNDAQLLERSLLQIANLAYEHTDLDTLYQGIHDIVKTLLRADNFFIGIYHKQKELFTIDYVVEEGIRHKAEKQYSAEQLRQTASFFLIRNKKSLLCDGKGYEAHINNGDFKLVGPMPHSWLGVPFEVNQGREGVIVVQSYEGTQQYTAQDKDILTYISRQIALAIDRHISRQELEYRALHDELTGLANRSLLIDRMEQANKRLVRSPVGVFHALCYLDFDRFKAINDSLGHEIGDAFLINICKTISSCIRQMDTFARLGGDEFAILMENVSDRAQVDEAIHRIQIALKEPMNIAGHVLQASTSIGVALCENPSDKPFTVLQQADAAMYEAKSLGRGQVQFFNEAMRQKLKTNADIENDLQAGISNDEFELYFQAIFDIQTEQAVGFEALVRWHHPKRGFVSPDDFIPIAEQTGQIINLDLHLLTLAAKQIFEWLEQGHDPKRVTVNVSSRHFTSFDFVNYIKHLYEFYELPHGSLCLEITESGLIANLDIATRIIKQLEAFGVKLYLDDFGTGYSALGYLHQLPIHVLKIDKSFIDHLQRGKASPLVDAILTLAESLGLEVVAEGIESVTQLEQLKLTHCHFGQGYLKAHPVVAKDAIKVIDKAI